MPKVSTRSCSSKFVLKSCIARYGTLCHEWDTVHAWSFQLILTTPMHSCCLSWQTIYNVHDEYVVLTYLAIFLRIILYENSWEICNRYEIKFVYWIFYEISSDVFLLNLQWKVSIKLLYEIFNEIFPWSFSMKLFYETWNDETFQWNFPIKFFHKVSNEIFLLSFQ